MYGLFIVIAVDFNKFLISITQYLSYIVAHLMVKYFPKYTYSKMIVKNHQIAIRLNSCGHPCRGGGAGMQHSMLSRRLKKKL